jgi:hypothetical protein
MLSTAFSDTLMLDASKKKAMTVKMVIEFISRVKKHTVKSRILMHFCRAHFNVMFRRFSYANRN